MHDSGRTEHNIIGLCFIQHETDIISLRAATSIDEAHAMAPALANSATGSLRTS
jgi:hypothetical protein